MSGIRFDARACVFMAVRKATRGRGNFINGGEVRRCVCVCVCDDAYMRAIYNGLGFRESGAKVTIGLAFLSLRRGSRRRMNLLAKFILILI